MIRLACIVLAIVAALPTTASACSVASGYRVPTNLELVARAEVVALVEVVSGPSEFKEGSPSDAGVKVRPLRFLKGTARAEDLSLTGLVSWNGKAVPAIVTPLDESHFSVGLGACVRMFYTPGDLLIATYERTDGRLHQVGAPFSRAVENVSGPDDLWVRIAARYVDIASGPAGGLEDRARAARDAAQAADDIVSAALAVDLDRHLAKPTPDRFGWFTANGPNDSAAMLAAAGDIARPVGVYCAKDGRIGMIAAAPSTSPVLHVGDRTFETATTPERLSPAAADLVSIADDQPRLFRFKDAEGVLTALVGETRSVGFARAGGDLAQAPPGDALYRLASRCRAWR